MIGPGFAAGVGVQTIKWIAIILVVVACIAGLIGYELAVWRECSSEHQWWYCLRLLAR